MEIVLRADQISADFKSSAITRIGGSVYEITSTRGAYIIEVISVDFAEKKMKIRHKHHTYDLVFKNELDLVMDNMGIKRTVAGGDSVLKAPMPGKVVDVMVKPGEQIEAGSALLVLEAMKMENVLKSSYGGVISKILVTAGETVEKNQILIEF